MVVDICIIGGGPAGSNLARLLSPNFKVMIIEKRNMFEDNNVKNKVCGGLLAPDAQHMLAKFNLSLPKDVLVKDQVFVVKSIDLDNDIERRYQKHYFNMDREKFDRWLFSLIPKTVEKKVDSLCKSIEKVEDGYIVRFKNEEVKAKYIVGADGANSFVRRKLITPNENPKLYTSIQEWYENTSNIKELFAIFDEELTDFYSWIIPKNEYIILGGAFLKENVNQKFLKLKEKLEKRGIIFGEKVKSEGTYIERPLNLSQINFGKENIFLIGEASGSISPSSAEGISYGLKTSEYLAKVLNSGGNIKEYEKKCLKIKLNILGKNIKSIGMYNKYIRNIVMKSRIFSIK